MTKFSSSKKTEKQLQHNEIITQYKKTLNAIVLARKEIQSHQILSPIEIAYTQFIKRKERQCEDLQKTASADLIGFPLKEDCRLIDSLENQFHTNDFLEIEHIKTLSTASIFSKFLSATTTSKKSSNAQENNENNGFAANYTEEFETPTRMLGFN